MKMLLILGMHRSGTSLLAGSCRLLGADLGGRMMEAGQDNVMGFWEHDEIVQIHDQVLERLGFAWDDVRALPDKWWTYQMIQPQREALKTVLQRDFGASTLGCVKDPRLCRLLPLWQELLKELDWQPLYLLASREPGEIAASLKSRNGFSAEKSALLTLRYSLDAEAGSRDGTRAMVDYGALLKDWRAVLKPAWEKLGLSWPADTAALDAQVERFIHKELRHHAASDGLPKGALGKLIEDVYAASHSGDVVALDAAHRQLDDMAAGYDQILAGLYAELRAQHKLLADKEQEIRHVVEERGLHAGLALARAQEIEWQRSQLKKLLALGALVWHATKPVRVSWQFLRAIPRARYMNRGMVRLVARDIYYVIPMPQSMRIGIRRGVGRLLGMGLPGSAEYKARAIRGAKVDMKGPAAALALPEGAPVLELAASGAPQVSVIIPVYNNIAHTLHCLKSIAAVGARTPFEVIVVDDCSKDETQAVLARCQGVRVVKNEKNLGFIGACNAGAAAARGEYVYFLNNDVQVLLGWLDELRATFDAVPEAGLVGSKLVYPDGRLQEAGGIVWKDGSAWNYGRFDDPDKPEYSYRRDVDYCSGASIMLPRALFDELGRFDEHYAPAYCEDTDLAFQVKKHGRRVLFQPLSVVVHYEGVTSGTDLNSGVKKYQVVNQKKFYERWKDTLDSHRPNGIEPRLEKDRGVSKRVLVIDANTPRPDHDAGSLLKFYHLKLLQSLGYQVTFVPDNLLHDGEYTRDLQRLGVECIYEPHCMSMRHLLTVRARDFDLAMLCRPYVAIRHIDALRRLSPETRIIYDTVDLHYLRERRQAEMEKNPLMRERAERTRQDELKLITQADAVIVVSPVEKDILARDATRANVHVLQLVIPEEPQGPGFETRRDILFIGGYQHTPNVEAVLYFCREILPGLQQRIPDLKFLVLGSRPTPEIQALASEHVKVLGFQKDISPYFNACRLMVAPLRFGAGIKGKLGTSFSYGLPVVASTIAAEGMFLQHGREALIADTPQEFADAVVRLYNDPRLWAEMSTAGRQLLRERFSPEVIREGLVHVIASIDERALPKAAG